MKITSLAELEAEAQKFVENIEPNGDHATVIALQGDLGAGKTTFTQAVAQALGVTESLTSPTFVLMKRYSLSTPQSRPSTAPLEGEHTTKFENLIHVDAYRLDNGDDLRKLRFEDVLNDPTNLVMIEWPEIVEDIVPEHAQKISFTFINDTEREIMYA